MKGAEFMCWGVGVRNLYAVQQIKGCIIVVAMSSGEGERDGRSQMWEDSSKCTYWFTNFSTNIWF